MTGTDRVIFSDVAGRRISGPWAKDWPPPPRLYLVRDSESMVLVDPDEQSEETLAKLVLDHGASLFIRRSASEVSEPALPDEHWFRGALYDPWRFGDG